MERLRRRIEALLSHEDYPGREHALLVRLMVLFGRLPAPPDPDGDFPRYEALQRALLRRAEGDDAEALEEAFLALYAHVHMHEARYTPRERRILAEAGGYWAHAGGVSPILKAGPFINPETVSMDLGAGNGLQGLLLQTLHPHARTIQVEISTRMVEIGRRLQAWLGVPTDRVTWVAGDVCLQPLDGVDFVYLYRPVRPSTAKGRAFYERLAATLGGSPRSVAVFSVADCLGGFLSDRFEVVYGDGHLTCFRG